MFWTKQGETYRRRGGRRKRNIRTRETSGNSPAPGMHYSGPWNCMWVRILMIEFTKITPVSIGLLVDDRRHHRCGLRSAVSGPPPGVHFAPERAYGEESAAATGRE